MYLDVGAVRHTMGSMSLAERSLRVTGPEDLKKGDEVHVIVKIDPEGNLVKRKPARVVDVLRKAAVLAVEGEKDQRTVRFSELELKPPTEPPPPPPKAKSKPKPRRHLRSVAPKSPRSPKEEPVKEVAPPTSIDQWAQQGKALQDQLIAQSHEIENQMRALIAEAEDLEMEALRKRDEAKQQEEALAEVRQRITVLDQLTKLT